MRPYEYVHHEHEHDHIFVTRFVIQAPKYTITAQWPSASTRLVGLAATLYPTCVCTTLSH